MPSPSLSDQRQIDIICDQFENQWDANHRPDFSSFTDLIDTTLREALLHMLLEIDVELRTKAKHTIEAADYLNVCDTATLFVHELMENKSTIEAPILRNYLPAKIGYSPTRTIKP